MGYFFAVKWFKGHIEKLSKKSTEMYKNGDYVCELTYLLYKQTLKLWKLNWHGISLEVQGKIKIRFQE